jgi:glutathione synthase/RimK-type ligase-like ATP-grasp enzyme
VRSSSGWLDVASAFGYARDRRFRFVSAAIYRAYPFPLLRFRMFHTEDGWRLGQIQPLPLPQASPEEVELLAERLGRGPTALAATAPPPPRLHRLAILWDPEDKTAPSDEGTLDRLARVAGRRGLIAERIGKNELGRLAEYDALFIRTVTAINHVSFTFSQTAASLGMPVIDDPASIVKCSNKIFLYELFRKHGLPMPDTTVLSPRNWREEVRPLGWPVVLKVPDGTFSLAVKMAKSEGELEAVAKELFRKTPLLLAQRFTPSTFDWRVGVLEGRPLWTARYHMAPGHWQIADRSGGSTRYGKVEAVPIEQCPKPILDLALAGTALIGDGLYGVDIKETESGPVLIEINDNPNLDTGLEDAAEKDRPYEAIVDSFLRRIEAEGRTGAAEAR